MKKLKKPIELKGRVIQYKPVAKLSNKKINVKKEGMIGGGGGPSKLAPTNNKQKSTTVPEVVQASIYNFVNSPRGNPAEGTAQIYNFVNSNSLRGNSTAGPAVERNNREALPKITDELTVEEFNKIVCAMIDYLFEQKLIAMPPSNDEPNTWKGKGYKEPTIEYFWLEYPNNDLKETMKTIIKENLQMAGEDIIIFWDSDGILQQVNKAIDNIPIDAEKWRRYNWQIRDELEKIKMIIIKIISVISDIYNTTYNNRDKFWKLTTPDHHDIFSEIYIELIKKYYYTLGHLKNPNSDSD